MNGERRILLIDSESSGLEIKRALEGKLAESELPVNVALARNHREIERLLWRTRTKRGKQHRASRCSFDLGVVNLGSSLAAPGPIPAALRLQEERKIPVIIYSPPYTGRVRELEQMVANTFTKVCDVQSIPDAALLHLLDPKNAGIFMSLLSTVRTMGSEALTAHQRITNFIATMETVMRQACERILAREKEQWKFA